MRSWGPYNIFGVTDRSINYHFAHSSICYLLLYTQPTKPTGVSLWNQCRSISGFYIILDGLPTKTNSVNKNVKYKIREY
jgi:hypothetical protein